MIEIFGSEGTEEYAAAIAIKDALARLWPGTDQTPSQEDYVRIATNVRVSGYSVGEFDVVLACSFARERYFVPSKPLKDSDGKLISGARVRVRSLMAVIEVKGQPDGAVRVSADQVSVRYADGWKSATDQNDKQVHAISRYLKDQWADCWIYRCLILQGLQALPRDRGIEVPQAGAVAQGFSGKDLLTALAGVGAIRSSGKGYFLSSGPNDKVGRALHAPIFRTIVPSNLDRERMDRIAARKKEAADLGAQLGTKRVHIRGRGGTGKTVMLLQACHEAYERFGKRVLILTYNLALAADIQRLLALMAIPAERDGGGVEVRTVMSFMSVWMRALGVVGSEQDGEEADYVDRCAHALQCFDAGALTPDDVRRAMDSDPDAFDFDAIVVDEAQDWPQQEADLLARIYGGQRIALADGGDQLVRGRPTNWRRTIPAGTASEERALSRCLRMKRNLGIFGNSVALAAGLNWTVQPNDEAAGGRVLLMRESYGNRPEIQHELVVRAAAEGNSPIDFLHCVPPSDVSSSDGRRASRLGLALCSNGYQIWDGVDPMARHDFARSVEQFRIVQYDSCRGLEGWVVVLDLFDEFLAYKRTHFLARAGKSESGALQSPEDYARQQAWRWAMIALSRPIDTLVLSFRDPESEVGRLFWSLANKHGDFAQVVG